MPVNYGYTKRVKANICFIPRSDPPSPTIYFGWGYDLIAGGSIDDGLPDLYARVKQGHQLGRLARTDMPNVLSPVVYD